MARFLIATIYLTMCATAALLLIILRLADVPMAALIGAMLLLVCMQLHTMLAAGWEKQRMHRELAQVRDATKQFALAIEEANAKIDKVRSALDEKTSASNREVVSELHMLEGLMREFATKAAPKLIVAEPVQAHPAAVAHAELTAFDHSDLLETVRAALAENRVDLYLQPMVGLPQRKLRAYEALSRLRAEDGTVIMPSQYMRVAGPAGLMSVVDNLLLFRCVQVMRRLIQKNRDVAMFCNISGDTLADTEFFPQFLEYMHHNRDLAGQLVFEFTQSTVLHAGHAGEENLKYLASLGFSLSMDHVEALALDYAKLKALGFRHLKIRAGLLTAGLEGAQPPVAAEDLKTFLQRQGIALIAERVEHEKSVVELLDFGIEVAQGYLFGEPRALRDDAKTLPDMTAAILPLRRSA